MSMSKFNLTMQKFFRIDARKTSLANEVKNGLTTAFISMFVILSSTRLILQSSGYSENQLLLPLISIVLLFSALTTLFGSIYSKLPLIFISTIGFNVLITERIIAALSLPWGVGLGIIVIESILFSLLSFTNIPFLFFNQLPSFFKKAAPLTIGGMLIFFSLLAAKIISFKGTSEIVPLTFRSSPLILFSIGTVSTYFLIKEKASLAYLQGFLLTLLLGMIIPNFAQGTAFYLPIISLGVVLTAWMLLYSILVDKHCKKSLEISLWVVLVILFVIVIFNNPSDPIIAKPMHLFGKLGIFSFPVLKDSTAIIGLPIFSLVDVFKNISKLIVPIFTLLIIHWLTYYSFLESMNHYLSFKKNDQEIYFNKKAFLTEGSMSLFGSVSGAGFFSSSIGSLFSILIGCKTAFSSIITSFVFVIFLFIIPGITTSFTTITFAPVLFLMGFKLINSFLPSSLEEKEVWVPILAMLLIGTLTMSIYTAFFSGLVAYLFIKTSSGKLNEISSFSWVLFFTLFFWSFFRISNPFLVL